MGKYFNPTDMVEQVGRKLSGTTYQELTEQLQPGESLVGLYDRFIFQNAPHLFSEQEFEGFESQARSGMILRLGFFAVSEGDYQNYVR